MRAADRNDVEAVKALIPLQKGRKITQAIKINNWLIYEATALMRAAAHGNTDVVKLLAEYEGGVQNTIGDTALMIALFTNHPDCVEPLFIKEGGRQDKYGLTALMLSAKKGYTRCVSFLLDKEGGMQDNNGWTALIYAVYYDRPECARLLVDKEKNIKTTRDWSIYPSGSTVLDIAEKRGRIKMKKMLLE